MIDQSGAENLCGKGDALVDIGRGVQRVQIPYIPRDQFLKMAKKCFVPELPDNYQDIHELRTMDYREYLKTDHWKKVRRLRLEIDGHRCVDCKAGERLEIHHKIYDHRGCEQDHLGDLVTLCRDCHQGRHDK